MHRLCIEYNNEYNRIVTIVTASNNILGFLQKFLKKKKVIFVFNFYGRFLSRSIVAMATASMMAITAATM
jgi:hypothetical protein